MSESNEEIIKPMPKAGKSITSKTIAITVKHPKISEMVLAAITALNEKNGSSLHAIKQYISATYNVDTKTKSLFIKKFVKKAVLNGELHQKKGKGATGSFIIPKKSIKKLPKKKVVAAKKVVTKKASSSESNKTGSIKVANKKVTAGVVKKPKSITVKTVTKSNEKPEKSKSQKKSQTPSLKPKKTTLAKPKKGTIAN